MTIAVVLLFAAIAVVLLLGVHRRRLWPASRDYGGWPDDDTPTGVREPRRPLPSGSDAAAVALPEAPEQDLTARAREIEEP